MNITKAEFVISNTEVAKCPLPNKAEYAFIGRSNVGKSSLINMLTGKKNLAKTSATPGKTQLINHFIIESNTGQKTKQQWYLVDLPGYGYAKIAQSSRRRWEQMIENYLRKRSNLVNVFVLVDSRHTPQKIDLEFLQQLAKWDVPFMIVFTKSDKEKPGVVQRNVTAFLDAMRTTWQFLPQSFITSAEKKLGKEEILQAISTLNTEWENAPEE